MSRTERNTKVPTGLRHKPIYVINRYDRVDGFYKNDTDVIGLSLGKAQWSRDNFIPSVKVWRDIKSKDDNAYRISRQSEETTLTRALDLAMLTVKIYDGYVNHKDIDFNITDSVFGALKIETEGSEELREELKNFFIANADDIKEHIKILKATIENTEL